MKRIYSIPLLFLSQITFAQSWYNLGNGLRPLDSTSNGNVVNALAVDSVNHLLYAGGNFYYAGDSISPNFAAWDGQKWLAVSSTKTKLEVYALLMYKDTLFIGGKGGVSEYYDHKFHSTAEFGGPAFSLAIYHDTLYAGAAGWLRKLVSKQWVAVDSLGPFGVFAMCVYQDQLIIGGAFNEIDDLEYNHITAWDGRHWHELGKGTRLSASPYLGQVEALTVYEDTLIVGGYFDTAGSISTLYTAKWDGTQWYPMEGVCGEVNGLGYDNKFGLYATGGFGLLHGDPYCNSNVLARWSDKTWIDLNFGSANPGQCINFFNKDLIVGGQFSTAGGVPANRIAGLQNGIATSSGSISKQTFQIYPNPAKEEVNISFPFSNNIITLSDLYGREIKHMKIANGNNSNINLQYFVAGVYFIILRDEKGNYISSQKLLKE